MARISFQKIFFIVMILIQPLDASEIYKWTDKEGKIHFSQKKPKQSTSLESLKANNNNAFKGVALLKPIKNSISINLRHILVVRPDLFWRLKTSNKKAITYYFGGDCVSPVKKSFIDMKAHQTYLLPRVLSLIDYIVKPIVKLNYSVSSSRLKPLKDNTARYEQPLILEFLLDDIKYDLCATNLSRQYRGHLKLNSGSDPFDFSDSEYKRRRAVIKIKWRLMEPNSGKVLFNGSTSGSANDWNADIQKFKLNTIKTAMENATSNLFADPNFVKSLTPKSGFKHKMLKSKDTSKVIENKSFDSISDLFNSNAIKKAEFVKVLSRISPLKIMVTEYYMMENEWPLRLSDIAVTRVGLFDENTVSSVEFDYDGSIVLTLDSQKFGSNAKLSLTPKYHESGGRVEWRCLTSLEKEYYGQFCNGME